MLVVLKLFVLANTLSDLNSYLPMSFIWGHLISFYVVVSIHILDDASTGITAKGYRLTQMVFESGATFCWTIVLFATNLVSIRNSVLVLLTFAEAMIWLTLMSLSLYVIFYLKKVESDEGVFPDIMMNNDGRIVPKQDLTTWLVQPRNKTRLLLAIIYLIICLSPSAVKGLSQASSALGMAFCLVFCMDDAWRTNLSLKYRVSIETVYDFMTLGFTTWYMTSGIRQVSDFDQSIDYLLWIAASLHVYVSGWSFHRLYAHKQLETPAWLGRMITTIDRILLAPVLDGDRSSHEERRGLIE
jgi:hypothetical protein